MRTGDNAQSFHAASPTVAQSVDYGPTAIKPATSVAAKCANASAKAVALMNAAYAKTNARQAKLEKGGYTDAENDSVDRQGAIYEARSHL